MPRVTGYTTIQKLSHQTELLAERCDLLLYKTKISKSKVAEYVGITPQAVHKQFKIKHLSPEVIIAVVTMTDADAETVKKLFKVET